MSASESRCPECGSTLGTPISLTTRFGQTIWFTLFTPTAFMLLVWMAAMVQSYTTWTSLLFLMNNENGDTGYEMTDVILSIENGRIQETNFDRYPILRIRDAPQVESYFVKSDFSPTGVGEPSLPPLAPAVCNAIFAATGHRVRTLPLKREGFSV